MAEIVRGAQRVDCYGLSRVHSFAELVHRDAKRTSKADDDFDSRITNTALNAAQVRAVEISLLCEFVLGKSSFVADTSDVPSEGRESFVLNRHLANHAANDACSSVAYRLQCSKLEHQVLAFLEFYCGNFFRVHR